MNEKLDTSSFNPGKAKHNQANLSYQDSLESEMEEIRFSGISLWCDSTSDLY